MSTPTRQDIINAHNALEKLNHMAWNGSEDMYDKRLCALWKKQILAALPPKPQPTMAEIAWDSDKHFLTEAEHPGLGKVIMVDTVFTPRKPTFMSSQLTRTRPTAFSQPPATSPRPASATHSRRSKPMPASPHPTNEFAFFPDPSWTILTPENLAAMAEQADQENSQQGDHNA